MSIDLDEYEAQEAAGEEMSQESRMILALCKRIKVAESERTKYAKHADEGWALANRRTEQWKQVEQELDETRDGLDEAHEALYRVRRAARAWKALVKHYRETQHAHGITRCEDCNKPANIECLHRWRCMPCFEEWKERYERDKETR